MVHKIRDVPALFLLVLVISCVDLYADSRLIFPRVVFQQGRFFGVAIANPTATSAAITLKAYRLDGNLFASAGFQNPASSTIGAGKQYALLASQIFNASPAITESTTPIQLWVEVTSPVDGLTGFFIDGDYNLTLMDGADLTGTGNDLVLPLIDDGAGASTQVSIVNPNNVEARLSVDLVQSGGTTAGPAREATLGPMQALHGTLSGLFGAPVGPVAALRIRSDRSIAAVGYILRNYENSLVVASAQNASTPSKTLFFPQMAEGGDWRTTLGLVNLSGSEILVTISAFKSDGTLWADPGMTNPVSRKLSAGAVFREGISSLLRFTGSSTKQGWIKAEAGTAALAGYVEYGAGSNRALVAGQADAFARAIFSHQALADPLFTGLAILNPSSLAANVEIHSLTKDREIVGSTQSMFRPGQHQAFLVHERIPAALGINGGYILIKSDTPIMATQLFGTSSLTALANVPPQKIPASFNPAATVTLSRVVPPLAVVETGKTQKFELQGTDKTTWLVNDIVGGNVTVGTISDAGMFSAPGRAPTPRSVTVRAQAVAGNRSAGATVDLVQRDTLVSGLTVVTAIAYLDNLQRFSVAEQAILSGAPSPPGIAAPTTNSRIIELSPTGDRTPFKEFNGDAIGKMIPFVDRTRASYLLIAGTDSGTIYRLKISDDKQITNIATGLKAPKSLALDPVSGNLLVSEQGANQITVIPRSQFDPTATAPGVAHGFAPGLSPEKEAAAIAIPSPQGIAFNYCSGALYVTSSDGKLQEFSGKSFRVIIDQLQSPGEILVLNREGMACAVGVNVLVADATGISRILPDAQERQPFFSSAVPVRDLVFIPKGSPFALSGQDAIGVAESPAGSAGSAITEIGVAGVYTGTTTTTSGGTTPEPSGGTVPYADPAGDTFATTSGNSGYKIPDLVSVDASLVGAKVVVTLTFTESMAPASAHAPNSLYGFVDFDGVPGGINSHVDSYNPLSPTGMAVDVYIDLSTGIIYDLRYDESFLSEMSFLGNTVTIRYTGTEPVEVIERLDGRRGWKRVGDDRHRPQPRHHPFPADLACGVVPEQI